MNLREQLYVCTLARCQTISRAAEELYLSPPALSVAISNLEKQLGVKLFDRTARSFVLTSIGEEYVHRAQKMLDMKNEFDQLIDDVLRKSHPAIRVGIQQRRAIYTIPETMQRFMADYPDVEVIFREGTQCELNQLYKNGAVDFMITMFQDDLADAEYKEIAREKILIALPKSHPAHIYSYKKGEDTFLHLNLKHLDGETFIVPPLTQSMGKTVCQLIEQTAIHPGRIIRIQQFETIMGMVEKGLGIGFNRLGYLKDMSQYQVDYYLIGDDSVWQTLAFVYRKGRIFSECERHLMNIMNEILQSKY